MEFANGQNSRRRQGPARRVAGGHCRCRRAPVPRTRLWLPSAWTNWPRPRASPGGRSTISSQARRRSSGRCSSGCRVSSSDAFPPGVETQGDVEDVLRLIARMILELHKNPEYLGFLRMVVADSRQFPWIAEEFAAVMDPQTERLVRYLAHLTAMGILDCRNPMLAATSSWGCSTSSLCGPG